MNVSMKTMIPTAMLALSAMTLSSCGSDKKNNVNDSTKNKVELAQFDSTKANLPVFQNNKIVFRTDYGEIKTVSSNSQSVVALYKAITNLSTPEKPNIEDVNGFYTAVQSNISKNRYKDWSTEDIRGITEVLHSNNITIFFDKLFNMFTAADSDGGKTITVKEYTQMMDAWSSTGVSE